MYSIGTTKRNLLNPDEIVQLDNTKDIDGHEIDKVCCRDFWKGRDSYRKLQNAFYEYITSKGFDLQRGLPAYLTEKEIESIAYCIQNLKVKVTNYRDYEFAQVCTGGIPLSDIDTTTFESKLVKHIYFTGEILDVDGICGGYNLHFAWASGYLAAKAILERSL